MEKDFIETLSYEEKLHLYDICSGYCSENKLSLFDRIVSERTTHLTVVLENVSQSQNASAILRSCECLGVQNVHVVEGENSYKINPDIVKGSIKWLTLHRYKQTADTFHNLKKQGYKIVAATPHKDEQLLEDLDVSVKTALVFGTEHEGLSDFAIQYADEFVKIPMHGFTESLNISVAAALCMYSFLQRAKMAHFDTGLTSEAIIDLKLIWLKKSIRNADKVMQETFKREMKNE